MAHTRLAIIDLTSAGHQPMTSPDGRYTLVYNGEIYNHMELRPGLEAHGVRFRGHSDTETLLCLLATRGTSVLDRRPPSRNATSPTRGLERMPEGMEHLAPILDA